MAIAFYKTYRIVDGWDNGIPECPGNVDLGNSNSVSTEFMFII